MNKKILLIIGLMALCFKAEASSCQKVWQKFKDNFIREDSYIIDPYKEDKTHTEGQGYSMYLAVKNKDKHLFDNINTWTYNNMGKRIKPWLFENGKISDFNNATDGDILITWSLIKAYELWGEKRYLAYAEQMLEAIEKDLIKGGYVLPWKDSDEAGEKIVNLSYYIFPAFKDFMKYSKFPEIWEAAYEKGISFLKQGKKEDYYLPPDWFKDNGGIAEYPNKPMIFGHDAIRIPLHLLMAEDNNVELFASYVDYLSKNNIIEDGYDFKTKKFSSNEGGAGHYAIMSKVAKSMGNEELALKFSKKADERITKTGDDYYGYVLYLITCTY